MPLKSRTTLKSYFEANDRPTASQYIDLIDSIPNFVDDNPTYGFNWKGDWDNSIRYVKYDSVYYDVTGASYVCIKAHDAFFVPTNTTYWSKISEKGADGDAATIAVGTVTTVASDVPASVTNVGTSAAAVFDFEIPKAPLTDITAVSNSADAAAVTFAYHPNFSSSIQPVAV